MADEQTLFEAEREEKLGWNMILELDWHIPWESGWTHDKKSAAASKLVDYFQQGTMYETNTRMKVTKAEVVAPRVANDTPPDPFIRLRLEH